MVSINGSLREKFEVELREILKLHSVKEMKWSETKSDVKVDTIMESLDIFTSYVNTGKKIRVDVLIWNIGDSRHRIQGRDDTKNLQIMYYHVLRNVINKRWPNKLQWYIFPDENSAIEWRELERILNNSCGDRVKKIEDRCSSKNVVIQLADIFAGMASYSWGNIGKYDQWLQEKKGQTVLFQNLNVNNLKKLSNTDRYRWKIIDNFYHKIKRVDLECNDDKINGSDAIMLGKGYGLHTKYPTCPINFWLYTPQTDKDKAPRKNQIFSRKRRNESVKNEWW